MLDAQIQTFKTKLEVERKVLEEELSKLGERNPSNPQDWVPAKPMGDEFTADRNDNADIIEAMQDNNAPLNELEGQLNNVRLALKKIEEGAYGICEIAGEQIELDRLTANPAARTCKVHMKERVS